jgi:hypothetical protein
MKPHTAAALTHSAGTWRGARVSSNQQQPAAHIHLAGILSMLCCLDVQKWLLPHGVQETLPWFLSASVCAPSSKVLSMCWLLQV